MGYESQNFTLNMGTSFFIMFFFILILVFYRFSEALTKRYPFLLCKQSINNFFANTMLNFLSRIIFESYLSYSLMCLIYDSIKKRKSIRGTIRTSSFWNNLGYSCSLSSINTSFIFKIQKVN